MTTIQLPESKLVKDQKKTWAAQWTDERGDHYTLKATVRHDDQCGNGHNTFAITGDLRCNGREYSGGMLHDEIAERIPELVPFLKWHLVSTDGPMHYVANALYWAGQSGYCDGKDNSPPNDAHLKSTIVYGALPDDAQADLVALAKEGRLKPWLEGRLPAMLEAFKADVESLGFTY